MWSSSYEYRVGSNYWVSIYCLYDLKSEATDDPFVSRADLFRSVDGKLAVENVVFTFFQERVTRKSARGRSVYIGSGDEEPFIEEWRKVVQDH